MIAKFGTWLWVVIAAVLLVRYLGWYNPNLVVSAIIWTAVVAVVLQLSGVRPRVACWAGAGSLVISFMITCMVAGDWEHAKQIATTCIVTPVGTLHTHHGPKGALVSIINLVVFFTFRRATVETRSRVVALFGRRLLRVASWILIISVAMVPFIIRDGHRYGVTQSMYIDTIGYGLYLGLLALVCQEAQTKSEWFTTYLAISSGIALSVAASGLVEFQRDLVAGGQVPSTLIFWHSEGDPSCGVP